MRDQDKFAAVFRSARKRLGLTQVQVAQQLEVTQGSISKLEKGLYVPDIFLWLKFTQMAKIPVRSCEWGYIDWLDAPKKIELTTAKKVGRFDIPQKYAEAQGQSIRSLSPILTYSTQNLSSKQSEKIFDSLDLDSDFFVDYRNQINAQFLYDYVDQLFNKADLKEKNLDEITDLAVSPFCHGNIFSAYTQAKTTEELLATYIDQVPYYHCDFDYTLSKSESKTGAYDLSLTAKEHMSKFQASNEVVDFLTEFQKRFLEKFFMKFADTSINVKALDRPQSGVPGCTIRFQM